MLLNDSGNNSQVTNNMIKWVFVSIAFVILISILIVYLTKKYFPAVVTNNRGEGLQSNANYMRQLSSTSLPLYSPRIAPTDQVQLPPPAYSPPEPAINNVSASRNFVAVAVNH